MVAMPEVRINRDEQYPVYELDSQNGRAVLDVDEETLRRWRRIQAEYNAFQNEVHELLAAKPEYFDGRYWHI
jgi:phosphoenolpyruvate-protein kinase (PTS system EI component)